MCTKFQVDIFKNGWVVTYNISKTVTFHVISGLNRVFLISFWPIFDALKRVLRSFFAFFAKIWPINMCHGSKSQDFLFDLVLPSDLRWPWPILWSQNTGNDTNVRDTIHADLLALFELNIEILLADVTKPEMSKCRLWPDLWHHWWPRGH